MPRPARSKVRALAEQIRSGQLDARSAIADALADTDGDEALALLLATAAAGVSPDVDQVRDVLPLVDDPTILPVLVAQVDGDRASMLIEAVDRGHLSEEREAIALLLVALFGQPYPPKLAALLRSRARRTRTPLIAATLLAAAHAIHDPHVLAVMNETLLPFVEPGFAGAITARIRADLTLPVLDALPEHAERVVTGFTVRRAAAKVGRNDPCPCGSGKKYKRCCEGKEAPPTAKELLREAAETFTGAHVQRLRLQDLLRLDLAALQSEALFIACRRLLDYRRWDLLERALALLEERGEEQSYIDGYRQELIDEALEHGEVEVAKRTIAKLGGKVALSDSTNLLLEVLEPNASTLSLLEEHTGRGLQGDSERLVDLAYTLLQHRPALGIVFARGAMSPERWLDSVTLLEGIEDARDTLGLPPGDPAGAAYDALIDQDVDERVKSATSAAAPAAQERALAEAAELRERGKESSARIQALERRLHEQEARLAAREAEVVAQPRVVAPQPSAADDDARRRLRVKIEELKGLISEGNTERAELRRALAQHTSTLAKEDAPPPKDASEDDRFERDLPEGPSVRGVKIPTFAKAASEAIRELPARVARDTLAIVAGVASGGAAAWREVKQLERVSPPLLSARVGIHYRVLFRTTDVELEVLEVAHRQGLDAVIRRYA